MRRPSSHSSQTTNSASRVHSHHPTLTDDFVGPLSLCLFYFYWWIGATSPLFVTWNARTRRSSSGGGWNTRLRGCIGTFDAQPLRAALGEYALLSAFRDHRFRRIELRELPSLECGCVLSNPLLPHRYPSNVRTRAELARPFPFPLYNTALIMN